jgi:hypothetical protein
MIIKKKLIVSTLVACSLLFGGVAEGPANAASSSTSTATKASLPKGVYTYPANFSKTTATAQMKIEATAVIKLYADALRTGKSTGYNNYVNKHVAEKAADNFLLGRKYNRDQFATLIYGSRRSNKKTTIDAYTRDLKKVTTSKVKVSYTNKNSSLATFQYSYLPSGWGAFSTVTVTFGFYKLRNGKFVLEKVRIS